MWKNIFMLFLLGGIISIVLNVIQVEYKFSNNFGLFLQNIWWVIPLCGLGAVYIGLMYPYVDSKFGELHNTDREWTSVIRCVGFFLGLNHLSSVINSKTLFLLTNFNKACFFPSHRSLHFQAIIISFYY
jgi:hypothetical protein